jgi:hypothetical protein
MEVWTHRVRNFNCMNKLEMRRHNMPAYKKDCAHIQQKFSRSFRRYKDAMGKPLFRIKFINNHTYGAHVVPYVPFLGPPRKQSGQKFERKHQKMKQFAHSTNKVRLHRDTMTMHYKYYGWKYRMHTLRFKTAPENGIKGDITRHKDELFQLLAEPVSLAAKNAYVGKIKTTSKGSQMKQEEVYAICKLIPEFAPTRILCFKGFRLDSQIVHKRDWIVFTEPSTMALVKPQDQFEIVREIMCALAKKWVYLIRVDAWKQESAPDIEAKHLISLVQGKVMWITKQNVQRVIDVRRNFIDKRKRVLNTWISASTLVMS